MSCPVGNFFILKFFSSPEVWRLKSHPSVIVWSANNENEAALATDWFHIPDRRRPVYLKDYVALYVNNVMAIVKQVGFVSPFRRVRRPPTNQLSLILSYHFNNHVERPARDEYKLSEPPRSTFAIPWEKKLHVNAE